MVCTDPLADMLTRIRNGQSVGKQVVRCPKSRMRGWVLDVLKDEGYIRGYTSVTDVRNMPAFDIELKYHDGLPVIKTIDRVSKSGRRIYSSVDELRPFRNGLGIRILSTPRGVMSDQAARAARVGGEILCQIF